MNLQLNRIAITAILLLSVSINYTHAQRHSGMVVNVGVKKHFFSLTDSGGEKMEDFTGNITPFAGISYAHVLGPKISATYEFDFAFAKGNYTEKYDPNYEVYPITNPTTEYELSQTEDIMTELKSIPTLSVRILAHYRLVDGLFVSGGIGYDRMGFLTESYNESGEMVYGRLEGEIRSSFFNFNAILGVGYSTERFRIDARYNLGLSNLILPERRRYDLEHWRYDRLTVSQASLTFGYFIGAK